MDCIHRIYQQILPWISFVGIYRHILPRDVIHRHLWTDFTKRIYSKVFINKFF